MALAIQVTFQQIQKYEKGTNGVSALRLLQLANFLKVPVTYFYEGYDEYPNPTPTAPAAIVKDEIKDIIEKAVKEEIIS